MLFSCVFVFIFLINSTSSHAQELDTNKLIKIKNPGIISNEFENFEEIFFDEIKLTLGEDNNCNVFEHVFENFTNIKLILSPGITELSCPLNVPSNVIICGSYSSPSTLIFESVFGQSDLISFKGAVFEELETEVIALKGMNYLILSSSQFPLQLGDLIYIKDNDSDKITSNWAQGSTGQLIHVVEVVGDTVFFDAELRRNYSDIVTLQKIQPVVNAGLERLSILNRSYSSLQLSNITFVFADNCFIRCVNSFKCNFSHVKLSFSSHIEVSRSIFEEGFDYGNGGRAYGVAIQFGSGDCLIENNHFKKLRHSLLFQAGANGNVVGYNYSIEPYWTDVSLPENSAGDIVLHGNYPYSNLIEGNEVQNIVIDDSHGKNGPGNTFFRNRASLYGVFMNNGEPTDSSVFVGNEISNSAFLMGNFITSGNGNYLFGNNRLGTCIPSNTNEININSLYITSSPFFYENYSQWPPIGYPNTLNENMNEIQFLLANDWSLCNSTDTLLRINKYRNAHFEFQKIDNYHFKLIPNFDCDLIVLTDLIGREILRINNIEREIIIPSDLFLGNSIILTAYREGLVVTLNRLLLFLN